MLPIVLCQTDKFSCMGCCGHKYSSEKEVREGIRLNTKDFAACKSQEDLAAYSKKAEVLRSCGVCRGVVKDKDKVVCALHPARHKGVDHRDNICDKEYFCKTMQMFSKIWDEKTKQEFWSFIEQQKPDWYMYSMKMDQDIFLKEFFVLKSKA